MVTTKLRFVAVNRLRVISLVNLSDPQAVAIHWQAADAR
jgi:hypothetical protein